jgi:probable rRNA maturation factor
MLAKLQPSYVALQSNKKRNQIKTRYENYHQERQSEKDRRLLDKSRYFDQS